MVSHLTKLLRKSNNKTHERLSKQNKTNLMKSGIIDGTGGGSGGEAKSGGDSYNTIRLSEMQLLATEADEKKEESKLEEGDRGGG